MTQDELALKCGLDRSTILKYENNQVNQSLDIINIIAEVVGIIPSFIYDDYLNFISSNYGSKVKLIRKNLNLTQKEFGNLLGVHKKTIMRWENQLLHPSKENYKNLYNLYINTK